MKFFHYSSLQKLRYIAEDYAEDASVAFKPRRWFVHCGAAPAGLPPKVHEPAIFGLLDPLDKNWCSLTYHKHEPLLETILGDVSDSRFALLEIRVTPAEDIYVADHSPHLREDYDGRRGRNRKIVHEVKRAYWESLVPLRDYLANNLSYQLPEVICFTPILLQQIRTVETIDRIALINRVREQGGFLPYPPRPKPDPKVQARMLKELFAAD